MDKEKITVDMVWFVASGLFMTILISMILLETSSSLIFSPAFLIAVMNPIYENNFEVESSKFPRSIDTGNCRFGCVHVHDWMYIDCVNTGNMSYLNYTCEYCFKINEN